VIYMGRAKKYIVRLGSGQEVTAIGQANSGTDFGFQRGNAVNLLWRADDAIALPEN
jgi:hypothetical protein